MEKSAIDELLNQFASGQDPKVRQSIQDLISSEPGGEDLLKAYEKEPEKNRGLLEEVLGKAAENSDSPILKLILAALQGDAGEQSGKDDKEGGLIGEVLETLAENLLDEPKPRRKTRPKSKPKSKPKTSSSSRPKSKTGTKSKPKTSTSTRPKTKSGTKSRPKTKTGVKTKSKTQSKSKSRPRTKTKSTQIEVEV